MPIIRKRSRQEQIALLMAPMSLAAFASPGLAAQDDPNVAKRAELFESASMSDDELASITGRENVNWMSASSTNTAISTDNHVGDNNVTGSVNVTDSAFQNVSGIAMVNFNTGNNSAINAAMSVNLQINYAQPPALP